jgi:hypothetical protein
MKLIFCDTFTHARESDNVDEVSPSQPDVLRG